MILRLALAAVTTGAAAALPAATLETSNNLEYTNCAADSCCSNEAGGCCDADGVTPCGGNSCTGGNDGINLCAARSCEACKAAAPVPPPPIPPCLCDNNPCGSHGTCTPSGASYSCSCDSGWSGSACDHATGCDSSPCGRHGMCTPQGGAHTCTCDFMNEIDPYTQYNDLDGDSSASSSDDCKQNCCDDSSCNVWQWSDDPVTPPNCWRGDSDDYGDSGGVEWEGEQGKGPAPGPPPGPVPLAPAPAPGPGPLGTPCDLNTCECDGVVLAALKGKVLTLPLDAEGYSYRASFCSAIPAAQLPTGCQQYAENPAFVKYKADNLADCIEIGSIGPCSQGECGMYGTKTPSGVDVIFSYTYGCENRVTIRMQHGPSSPAPGRVTSDECSYFSTWVGAPIGAIEKYRCVKDKCVKTPPDLPGLDATTCAETCGPLKGCLKILYSKCDAARHNGTDSCNFCTGAHDIALKLAGCTKNDFKSFCDKPKPPPPSPPMPCCSQVCSANDCGTDCPICEAGGGVPGNGCSGCSASVSCDHGC